MPVTILNPYRSEPWAHAIQGLSGALEAYQRYKADDRDYKLKLEEVKLRREESAQERKRRDQEMAFREKQIEWQAKAESDKEEERKIRQEQERIGLGENLGIAKEAEDLSGLIAETQSVAPQDAFKTAPISGLGASLGDLAKAVAPKPAASLAGGPPTADIASAATGIFGGAPISETAPLEQIVAPQLDPGATRARTLAQTQAATERQYATPTGELSARERALGRQGLVDIEHRREVAELERREAVQDKRMREREREADERQMNLLKHQAQLQEARDRAAERRAAVQSSAAAAKQSEKIASRLRAEYTKETAKPRERVRAIERGLQMGSPAAPTATSDYSLVYAFAKASDPESAVREGEFQGIKTNIGGWPQQAQQYWRDIIDGKMTPQKRQEMVETINRGLDYEKKTMQGLEDHYRNLADIEDVDANRIFGSTTTPKSKDGDVDPGGILTDEEKDQNRQKTGNSLGLTRPPRR